MWLALVAGGFAAVHAGLALGQSGDASLAYATVLSGVVLLVVERVWPQQPLWREADGQWWNDLGHFVFGFGLGVFGGTWLSQAMFANPVWSVWPASWPLVPQIVLGLAVSEFGLYWQHRAVHTVPALWYLHALHHSTDRMTFFKTTRIHALDIGSATFLSLAPLMALGAPVPVLLWVTAFGNFAAQSQHANVRLPTPSWLNALVGTPAVHWLHHSLDLREGNSNFGMNLMIWDHLFGTYVPPGPTPRVELGIAANPVPTTFTGQLWLPWRALRSLFRTR
jgi:ornithine lipid hydroxylase